MFLADIDNLAYVFGVSERWRSRAEKCCHVELDDAEAAALQRLKLLHIIIVAATIPTAMLLFGNGYRYGGVICPHIAFWIGATAEVALGDDSAAKKLLGAAKATLRSFLSFAVYFILFLIAMA